MFETREEILERVILQKKPDCPYCGKPMSVWEEPEMAIDDGLGWGTPYLFICFNDECPHYKGGWDNIQRNFGRTASYRCLCYPDTGVYDSMTVYGPQGATGQIIDEKIINERRLLEEKTYEGIEQINASHAAGDLGPILEKLLDAATPVRTRVHAAEIIGFSGDVDMIDPLRNNKFGNAVLRKKVAEAVEKIHERHFTRECPYCAEIVKRQAKICKHCGSHIENGM